MTAIRELLTGRAPRAGEPPGQRQRAATLAQRVLGRPSLGAVGGALAVLLFFSFYTTQFKTPSGIATWLDPSSTLGIVAVAVALLMIGGEFDLSAGVMTGSTGLCMGLLAVELQLNVWLAMLGALLFAVAVGLLNGTLVVWTRLPSFIVTLGTFFMLQGLNNGVAQLVTNTVRVDNIDAAPGYRLPFLLLGSTVTLAGARFQVAILWWIALTALGSWLLLRTRVGNWVFAVGGNPIAARGVGVPVARVKIGLFIGTAVSAWLVGMMTALRFTSVTAAQGVGLELQYIIAAVVGGCLLTGGYGSVVGTSIGALIFGMAQIGIPFAGWNSNWFDLFLGIMLLFAVLINNAVRRRYQEVTS
ncbi:MAG TPA: ABC transporter permease [Candidatus Dormibacteraeota bacterium]|nr:ABC transporter permease [Candidatus Dormibacteraeota bacterium]